MNTEQNEPERRKFESWLTETGYAAWRVSPQGDYESEETNAAWRAWLARASSSGWRDIATATDAAVLAALERELLNTLPINGHGRCYLCDMGNKAKSEDGHLRHWSGCDEILCLWDEEYATSRALLGIRQENAELSREGGKEKL